MAFKGIFWIKPDGELLVLKVKCDSFGNLLENVSPDMLSKNGGISITKMRGMFCQNPSPTIRNTTSIPAEERKSETVKRSYLQTILQMNLNKKSSTLFIFLPRTELNK